ncbi:response regulator [Flammeovirgaceae bacterium SG7u.111]|nr:response regulator [Flammeovirgaceae bacterium SG7u.132]WPO37630.1 response regulator [Flammeovirgaceae bacterium SG7u.111]
MKSIYFVEPQTTYIQQLQSTMLKDDFAVEGFNNASECIKALFELNKSNQDMPDVIVIDYNLPGVDGLTLFEKLSPLLEDTKFILLMPEDKEALLFDVIRAGIMNYVMKNKGFMDVLETAIAA